LLFYPIITPLLVNHKFRFYRNDDFEQFIQLYGNRVMKNLSLALRYDLINYIKVVL